MDITYTCGNKVWRFTAVLNDSDADLDMERLSVPSAVNDMARKPLVNYIQLTDEQKAIDTTKIRPLTHFVVRSIWMVMAPSEPVPVTARWTVTGVGTQELFIPCWYLPEDTSLYTIEEWALEALMSDNWQVRETAVQTSTSELVHILAMEDENWGVNEAARNNPAFKKEITK